MVPDLRCVVEHAAFRRADDLFEGLAFERSAFDQVVEVSDIRPVVFTVVIFRGFCGNVRRQASFAYGNAGNSNDIATLLITFVLSHIDRMRFSPESCSDRPTLSRPGRVIVLRMLTFAASSEKPYNDKGYYHRCMW